MAEPSGSPSKERNGLAATLKTVIPVERIKIEVSTSKYESKIFAGINIEQPRVQKNNATRRLFL
jgi:hypothetical protein